MVRCVPYTFPQRVHKGAVGMGSIHHAKRNIRLTMVWPAITVLVGVLLLSGCAEFKISGEDTRIGNRTIGGTAAASNRNSSMAPTSFLEQLWGEISDGVTNRTRKMTGRQAPGHTLSEASWGMEYDNVGKTANCEMAAEIILTRSSRECRRQ